MVARPYERRTGIILCGEINAGSEGKEKTLSSRLKCKVLARESTVVGSNPTLDTNKKPLREQGPEFN